MKKLLFVMLMAAGVYSQCPQRGDTGPSGPVGAPGYAAMGWYNIVDSGAYGDGIKDTTASMTAGSDTVTDNLLNFESTDVGKVLCVSNVGRQALDTQRIYNFIVYSGTQGFYDSIGIFPHDTTGTIVEVINSHKIRASFNASITKSGLQIEYGHNDVAAIQKCITAVMSEYGSVIYTPRAKKQFYLLAGPLIVTDPVSNNQLNSQLYVACTRTTTGNFLHVKFLGEWTSTMAIVNSFGANPSVGGSTWKSIISGSKHSGLQPTVFRVTYGCGPYQPFNYTDITFDNMTILVHANTANHGVRMSILDLSYVASPTVKRCMLGSDTYADKTCCPIDSSFALMAGRWADNQVIIENTRCGGGFMFGALVGEMASVNDVICDFCYNGFCLLPSGLTVTGYVVSHNNCHEVEFTDTIFGMIQNRSYNELVHLNLNIEDGQGNAKWYSKIFTINDPYNIGVGEIRYDYDGGSSLGFNKNGGRNVICMVPGQNIPTWTTSTRPNANAYNTTNMYKTVIGINLDSANSTRSGREMYVYNKWLQLP
jgi:hypothetical protein